MSSAGMLGLLEGVGKGVSGYGDALKQNVLLQAQEQREMNLAKIKRQWANEDSQQQYEQQRTDQLADQQTAIAREDAQRKEERQWKLADQQTAIKNQKPSAFQEKVSYFDNLLKQGKITEAEHKRALGIAGNGMSQKEKLSTISSLRTAYEKATSNMMPGEPRPSFENWVQSNRPEQWAAIGGAFSQNTKANTPGQPQQSEIQSMFNSLMKKDPSTWDKEIDGLRSAGYTKAADSLRNMLQAERRKLGKSEDDFQSAEMYKQNRESMNNDPLRQPRGYQQGGGLLDDPGVGPMTGISTLH